MLLNFIKLAGWQLSGVAIGWMKIFPGGNFLGGKFPGVNFPGGSFPGWELSRWDLSWVGIFFGGSFPGGNCPVGIIRVGVSMLPLYHLIWRDTGRLANEAFTSNPIVSSKQELSDLKSTNCSRNCLWKWNPCLRWYITSVDRRLTIMTCFAF